MSLNRNNPRRDANEAHIVDVLRRSGAQVLRLNAFDMLVLFRGKLFMLDSKMPTGRPTKAQVALTRAGWPLTYVHSEMAALRAIGAVR